MPMVFERLCLHAGRDSRRVSWLHAPTRPSRESELAAQSGTGGSMTEIQRSPRQVVASSVSSSLTRAARRQAVRLSGELAGIDHRAVVRIATVQAEGFVAAEKLREVDRLAHTA